jgi:hypothetical protein
MFKFGKGLKYMWLGLKLGTKNVNYTEDITAFYNAGYFQFIELFVVSRNFNDTI